MSMYIQRYPFAPKAEWWKRYTDKVALGKRVIYRATNEIGFEIDGIPQKFQKRILTNGELNTSEQVDYIDLKGKAIKLLGEIYQYDTETENMKKQDFADEDLELLYAQIGDVINFEKNNYFRKFRFDCIKESDQQNTIIQPINGLLTNSNYLTIKTHNFSTLADKPTIGDILFYMGTFWMIEETKNTYYYSPRERLIYHITISKIEVQDV